MGQRNNKKKKKKNDNNNFEKRIENFIEKWITAPWGQVDGHSEARWPKDERELRHGADESNAENSSKDRKARERMRRKGTLVNRETLLRIELE